MKHSWKMAAALVVAAVFCVASVSYASGTQDKIDDVKESLNAYEQEMEAAQSILNELEQKKSDMEEYISLLDVEMAQIAGAITQVQGEIAAKKQEMEEAELQLAEAEVSRLEQYEEMKLRIQYLYESGESDYLEIILSAGSFSDLLNEIEYISQLSVYDKNRMAQYVQTERDIETYRAKLAEDQQVLLAKQDEVSAKQESLELLRAAKNEEMYALADQIDQSGGMVSDYESMIQENEVYLAQLEMQLEAELEEARKIAESLAAEEAKRAEESRRAEEESKRQEQANQNGSAGETSESKEPESSAASAEDVLFMLTWPVPDSHRITSPFGPRPNLPVAGVSPYHNGIDIGAPEGTDIVSVADGVVIYVGDGVETQSDAGGLQVWVSHENGRYITTYMHASKLIAVKGQVVKAGDVIAEVGTTGLSTGNRLDFRIMYNGGFVDPLGPQVVYIQ